MHEPLHNYCFPFLVQIALGLVVVFVVTTVTAVVGCWCGRKRRQRYQVGGPEKGIPDNDNRNKQQLGLTVSLLDDRKVYTYTLFKYDHVYVRIICRAKHSAHYALLLFCSMTVYMRITVVYIM